MTDDLDRLQAGVPSNPALKPMLDEAAAERAVLSERTQ